MYVILWTTELSVLGHPNKNNFRQKGYEGQTLQVRVHLLEESRAGSHIDQYTDDQEQKDLQKEFQDSQICYSEKPYLKKVLKK